ncbi:Hg(II)-responsive transcriptional regulator [Pseudalkalibacillus sp. SCS-8]|uniref:Hg(II)-responsive transcriptional regulator n=1 Tax=Pseudalkalibacillus nanhaiensis TaxID=3115291 RepID=UPI0032D9FE74
MGYKTTELAKLTGVNKETLRYYEKIGILPAPPRTASGYRLYPEETVKRIKFVRKAQELGFTLQEVDRLLGVVDQDERRCKDMYTFTSVKLDEIERKINDLKKMKSILEELKNCCHDNDDLYDCPIIDRLEN